MSSQLKNLDRMYPGILRRLQEQGFKVSLTRKSHIRVVAPNGNVRCGPGSPSDHRAYKNLLRDLKRIGFEP